MYGVQVNLIICHGGLGGAVGDSQVASLSRISGVSRTLYTLRQLKYLLNMYTENNREPKLNIIIGSKCVA